MERVNNANSKNPLCVWQLHKLLEPMHRHKQTQIKAPKVRPHYLGVVAFVYRNRFVVADQIQRRFSKVLRSARTTRRHLVELESLGWLGVMPTRGVSPVFPKVYYVTPAGARKLRAELEANGKQSHIICIDRFRRDGLSGQYILHELEVTEYLLAVWHSTQLNDDRDLLQVERRSLTSHPSFQVALRSKMSRLEPDAMYVIRQRGKGMMCHLLELDRGTMTERQLKAKFFRYESWLQSNCGRAYLIELYRQCGAKKPLPHCRISFVTTAAVDAVRRCQLIEQAAAPFDMVGQRLRVIAATEI